MVLILKGILGCTGTRNGITLPQKRTLQEVLASAQSIELHHGDDKGADKDIAYVAKGLGFIITGHPPKNDYRRYYFDNHYTMREEEFLVRNGNIVGVANTLIACPEQNSLEEEKLRSGTWATIRYARAKPIPILYIWPDGSYLYKETHATD